MERNQQWLCWQSTGQPAHMCCPKLCCGLSLAVSHIKGDGEYRRGTLGFEGFALKTYRKTEKVGAHITETFRKYHRRAGNSTVGWHRAYMNPEFPSTCVARFGITSWESPGHVDQQLCLCTNPAKLLPSLSVAPTTIFSEACTAQHLLLLFCYLLT